MARTVGGVILGYVTMFVLVFASFTVAYLLLGPEGSFRPGTYEPSVPWIVVSFVLGFGAAVAGGWVCARVARDGRAPWILAAAVVVIGLALAIPALQGGADVALQVRGPDVGAMEAMQNARTPGWIALLNPFLGAVGVLIGARLRSGRKAPEPA